MSEQTEFDGESGSWLATPISRRRFLLGAGSTGAAITLGPLVASCATAVKKSKRLTTTSEAWAKAPVTFIYLDTTEPNTLDPSLESEFDGMLITQNTYDALTYYNEATQKLEPWLATSWTSSQSGLEQTFRIRDGVSFIDGSKLDASAVALAMNRHLAIGAPAQAGYMLNGIESVKATGPMEVTFTTKAPQPWLPYHMVMFPIMSAAAIAAHRSASDPWAKAYFADHCVGTGPYKLVQWVHGTKIVLAKNTGWWNGPWLPGSIDELTIQWESDPSTRTELIESGVANFSTEWSIDDALTVGNKSGFTLHKYKAYNTDPMIAFNQAKPPMHILEVRQAFQYAFDYAAMRRYFRNFAQPTSGVLPPFAPYALPGLPEYKQDIPKAKALLAKSGVDVASLNLTSYQAGGYPDLIAGGTILQSSLAQVGVKVSLQTVPFSSLEAAETSVTSSPPLTSSLYNGIFSADPTSFLSSFLPNSFGNEFMHYNNPALVAAYSEASSATTAAGVKAGLDRAQEIIRADAPVIFGAIPELLIPVPNYLEGYVMQRTDDEYPTRFFMLRVRKH